MTKRKPDARSLATRHALIEAAEELFAREGFDKVSTRRISAAIGSSNTAAVAYHFGTKDALIQAIYQHRLPSIERHREALLDQADACGKGRDIGTMLEGLWLPLFEQVNDQGRRSYPRFLGSMIDSGLDLIAEAQSAEHWTGVAMFERIKSHPEFARQGGWEMRWTIVTRMVLNAIEYIDDAGLGTSAQAHTLFQEAMAMAQAALCTPQPD